MMSHCKADTATVPEDAKDASAVAQDNEAYSLRTQASQDTYKAFQNMLPGCKEKSAYCGYDWALPKSGDRHAQEGG